MAAPHRVEIAVEDLHGAMAAAAAGADRIELCSGLLEGGVTPSLGLLRRAVALAVPVVCLIRPRPGDFAYDPEEVSLMAEDVESACRTGAAGVAVGCLAGDGSLDGSALRTLFAAAGGLPVTCHRAFDGVADQAAALEELVALGFARVLTSGGAPTAIAGAERIAALVAQARGRIAVVAAGSVRAANVADLVRRTGVREVHSGAGARDDPDARGPGGLPSGRWRTDAAEVRALAAVLRAARG